MSKTTHTIKLKSPAPRRLVKRIALCAFLSLRRTVSGTGNLSTVLSEAVSDVRDAWRETASQKI